MVEVATKQTDQSPSQLQTEQQYLTFMMGNDEYGVDILAVQEIHCWVEPRPMPNTPDYICGVIDWRGTIVPIIDLRVRFHYAEADYTSTTVVIILKTTLVNSQQECVIGIVVDAVADVYNVATHDLKKSPSLGSQVDTKYIKGITKIKDSMIIILDLEKMIDLDELTQ